MAAFTLAEVLITLGVIGVVAALTLPTVISNYQKKTYVEGLKVAYTTLNQAFKAAMATEGVEKIADTNLFKACAAAAYGHQDEEGRWVERDESTGSSLCEKELSKYIKKVEYIPIVNLKNKLNGKEGLLSGADCSKDILGLHAWYLLDDKNKCYANLSISYNIMNSMSLHLYFNDYGYYLGSVYIDVNGKKGPNIYGRDAHFFVILEDGSVEPWFSVRRAKATSKYQNKPLESYQYYGNPTKSDSELDTKYCNVERCTATSSILYCGVPCSSKIIYEGWQMNY